MTICVCLSAVSVRARIGDPNEKQKLIRLFSWYVSTQRPSLPLGWGDKRPWERGCSVGWTDGTGVLQNEIVFFSFTCADVAELLICLNYHLIAWSDCLTVTPFFSFKGCCSKQHSRDLISVSRWHVKSGWISVKHWKGDCMRRGGLRLITLWETVHLYHVTAKR